LGVNLTYKVKKMRLFIVSMLSLFSVSFLQAQTLQAVSGSSNIQFKIKNLGVSVNGKFTGLTSTIQFDPAAIASASIQAQVDAKTVNTGIDMRDDHLRDKDYFDVKNFPFIKLVSTKIAAGSRKDTWIFSGKLTIKETTLDISFPFTAIPASGGFQLKGEFIINRRDFGVGGGSFTMGDKVTVSLDVLAVKS
jgi:polyisoprenoid-binding protein YceI